MYVSSSQSTTSPDYAWYTRTHSILLLTQSLMSALRSPAGLVCSFPQPSPTQPWALPSQIHTQAQDLAWLGLFSSLLECLGLPQCPQLPCSLQGSGMRPGAVTAMGDPSPHLETHVAPWGTAHSLQSSLNLCWGNNQIYSTVSESYRRGVCKILGSEF